MPQFNVRSTGDQVAEAFAPQISGKTVLITGVSTGGIGFECARVIAKYAGLVILAGRTESKIKESKDQIQAFYPDVELRTLILDLASFTGVRKAAAEVLSYSEPIHVLINNAAIFPEEFRITPDGFESGIETNYLGPFLFTALISPRVVAGGTPEAPARIVNVSSQAHRRAPFRFEHLTPSPEAKGYDKWDSYASTKTAIIQFTNEIAKRAQAKGAPVLAYSLCPGFVQTGIAADMKLEEWVKLGYKNEKGEWLATNMKTIPEGAATYIVAAFDPELAQQSGVYLFNCIVTKPAAHTADEETAARLWDESEEVVKQEFVI